MISGLALAAARHVAVVGGLTLAAASIGNRLLGRMRLDALERWVFSIALGLGVMAYWVLALGLLGRLTAVPALGGVAIGALLAAPHRELTRVDGRRIAPAVLVALVLIVVTAPIWLRALAPPLDWDAAAYHLPSAKHFVATHSVGATLELRFPIFTRLQQMLFALCLLARCESAAAGMQTVATVLTALALFCAGRRAGTPLKGPSAPPSSQPALRFAPGPSGGAPGGLFAAAIWLGSPLVVHLATSGYTDCGLSLYVALATCALFAWLDSGERAWTLLAGIFIGLGAATKYTALIVAAIAAVVIATAPRRERWRSLPGFLASTAIAGAPFYLLSFSLGGNPIFPFAASIFGPNPWWSNEDLLGQAENFAQMGTGVSLRSVLALPYRMAFAQGPYASDAFWLTPAFTLLAPLAFWLAWKDERARRLLVIAIGFGVVWFWGAQSARYLLPGLPALALAEGLALDKALNRPPGGRPKLTALFAAGLAAWGLLDGAWQCLSDLPPAPAQRSAWLTAHRPAYAAVEFLNREHAGYRIYQIGSEDMVYYADGAWLGDCFGPWRWSRVVPHLGDPLALERELRAMDVQYFMLAPKRMAYLGIPPHPSFGEHFRRIFENGAVILFELR